MTRAILKRLTEDSIAILWLPLLFFLGASVLTAWIVVTDYRETLASAEASLTNLANALDKDIARNVQVYDLAIQEAAEAVRLPGLAEASPDVRRAALFSRLATTEFLSAIFILDAAGNLRYDSTQPTPRAANFADREYFRFPHDHPGTGLYIDAPIHTRMSDQDVVVFSRAIPDESGRFGGLVGGSVEISYFRNLFASLELGPAGVVSLVRTDGTALARFPAGLQPGTDLSAAKPFQTMLQHDSGILEAVSTIDHVDRIYAYRHVGNLPLLVSVSYGRSTVLAAWRQKTILLVTAVTSLVALGAILLAALRRQLAARRAVERQALADLERRAADAIAAQDNALARAASAERLRTLGQLAAGIAHDFNNVLQSVTGCAAIIERRADDPDTMRHAARLITDAADRGSSITDRLLAFSRTDTARTERIAVASILEDVADMLRHTLRGAGQIEIRTQIDDASQSLEVEPNELKTVLLNLATNARDAMPEGGTLILGASPATDCVRLWVQDSGSGMDAETVARATEPFFTTKPVGTGTGLGLSMARTYAESSGGTLSIDSRPGLGTTVSLQLPAKMHAEPSSWVTEAGARVPQGLP